MIDYGLQRSTVEPQEIEILESKVFVASDVTPVNEQGTEEQPGFVGFEFRMTEYTKDEYIRVQAERNQSLEEEVTSTQLALCDVYELLG
ncbi:MAG: hypothetical protein ACOX1S_10265 [Anaerostipes sp.]|jgi:hypothetical protein|nr:hypothetical protein [Lachnospiraceae bacterium]